MKKTRKAKIIFTMLFLTLVAFFSFTTAFAASGKISCDPEDLAKMTPQERKRAEKICSKKAEKKVRDTEKQAKQEDKYNKYVKGHPAMEQVYKDHQQRLPTNSEKKGDKTIWTYMTYTTNALYSECEEFVFKNDGDELISTRKYKCE